jgi:hypothetical protein
MAARCGDDRKRPGPPPVTAAVVRDLEDEPANRQCDFSPVRRPRWHCFRSVDEVPMKRDPSVADRLGAGAAPCDGENEENRGPDRPRRTTKGVGRRPPLDASAVHPRLREQRRIERRVGLSTSETAKGSQNPQRLLDRTIAGETAQMPLELCELCCVKGRRPVRHVLDLRAFGVARTGPSARIASTFAQNQPLRRAT